MVSLVVLLLVIVTSTGAYVLGRRGGCLRPGALGGAVGVVLECAGLAVLFLGANVVIGLGAILGGRAVTGHYVSVYVIADGSLALLSALQALLFWSWWRGSR